MTNYILCKSCNCKRYRRQFVLEEMIVDVCSYCRAKGVAVTSSSPTMECDNCHLHKPLANFKKESTEFSWSGGMEPTYASYCDTCRIEWGRQQRAKRDAEKTLPQQLDERMRQMEARVQHLEEQLNLFFCATSSYPKPAENPIQ